MIQRSHFTTLLFGIGLIACQDNQKNSPLFSKVSSSQSGIHFENTLVDSDDFNIIEYLYFYNGGGVALGDINNDGLTDIYFSANQQSNKLYLNKGDFRFEDITFKLRRRGRRQLENRHSHGGCKWRRIS